MKYHVLMDGEWEAPAMRGYKLMCCDCGLVHRMDFKIRDGYVEFRAARDPRATKAARRGKRYAKARAD